MALPPLSDFSAQIPGLFLQDSLYQWVERLSQGDQAYGVVLTSQRRPLGVVRTERLLAYLLKAFPSRLGIEATSLLPGLVSPHGLDGPLSDYPELVETANTVLADLPLEEAWPQIVASRVLLLVDSQHQYVGAVAPNKVLQWLAASRCPPLSSSGGSRPLSPVWPSVSPPSGSPPDPFLQTTLVSLLEQLPLPFMLQSRAGQPVFRNRVWLELDAIAPTSLDWDPLDQATVSSPLECFWGTAGSKSSVALDSALGWSLQIARRAAVQDTSPEALTWQFIRLPLSQALFAGHSPAAFAAAFPERMGDFSDPFRAEMTQLGGSVALTCPTNGPDFWLVLALSSPATPPLATPVAAPKPTWILELSHELKSPLTSLLGLSTLLQDTRLGALNPRQTRYTQLLQQTVRQMISTVNHLLDWFRIETGQIVLVPAQIQLQEIGPQILRSLQTTTAPDGTLLAPERRFSWTLEPGLAPLLADPLRLQQMLYHLASNALIHTPKQVVCGLHIEQWGQWLTLTVWDRGPGLSARQQAQVLQGCYEPGEREPLQPGATGLGLLLAWHLVHLHGGDLSFVSSPGQGSQFTLFFPQTDSDPAASDPAYSHSAQGKTTLLLLACEAGAVIDAVVQATAATDYRVAIARSPAETLDKAQRLQPALILLHSLSFADKAASLIPALPAAIPILGLGEANPLTQPSSLQWRGWLSVDQVLPQLSLLLPRILNSQPARAEAQPLAKLTILHLTEGGPLSFRNSPLHLPDWLHPYHCRVLEVDDLVQADLLVRVWNPQVVVLDGAIAQPVAYLTRLAQQPHLSTCPLVLLTPSPVRVADQFPQLRIFPCPEALTLPADQATLQLLQVILQATTPPLR